MGKTIEELEDELTTARELIISIYDTVGDDLYNKHYRLWSECLKYKEGKK